MATEPDDERDAEPDDEPDDEFEVQLENEPGDEPDDEFEVQPLDTGAPDVVAAARRRYGGAGAVLAAGMFGIDQALTGKQKPEFVQIQEASSEPVDVDKAGISVVIDDTTSLHAPALERRAPLGLGKKKPRHR